MDIHVHMKERRIFWLFLINFYIALSDPTGKVLQICKTVLKTQPHKQKQHVKKQYLKAQGSPITPKQTHYRKNKQKCSNQSRFEVQLQQR